MNTLSIPVFDFQKMVLAPWTTDLSTTLWIVVMGFLVAAACGLIGNYLILRRMALVGDAISHSVLPGIALAFLISHSTGSGAMFVGALIAGIFTTLLIEVIHKKSRVKQDSAIGIAFTSLFAIGVILISLYASKVDLDQECVLYGEISFVSIQPLMTLQELLPFVPAPFLKEVLLGPVPVVRMAIVFILTVILIILFFKELLVSSFDSGLAASLGINATLVHYSLMSWLSVVVVSAFESVGAILVIAMLILPGATASLWATRLTVILWLSVLNAALSALLGFHLAVWLDCSTAGAMVVMASVLFLLTWIFSPSQGLLWRWKRNRAEDPSLAVESLPAAADKAQ